MSRGVDSGAVREAVAAVGSWLWDGNLPPPERPVLAAAVRLTARALAGLAPGASVEVRIPPFVAVQCVAGPRHTRGTPPNVVQTDARTWLLVVAGLQRFDQAVDGGEMSLSGSRAAEVARWFPLVSLEGAESG